MASHSKTPCIVLWCKWRSFSLPHGQTYLTAALQDRQYNPQARKKVNGGGGSPFFRKPSTSVPNPVGKVLVGWNSQRTNRDNSTTIGKISEMALFNRGFAKGRFPKGWFWRGCSPVPKLGTRVQKTGRRTPKPERGYKKRNDGTKNRNEVRVHSPKPPFYKTTLLFPRDSNPTPPLPSLDKQKTTNGTVTYSTLHCNWLLASNNRMTALRKGRAP